MCLRRSVFFQPHFKLTNEAGERVERGRGSVNCQVAVRLCKCGAKAGTQRGHYAQGAGKKICVTVQNQSALIHCSDMIYQYPHRVSNVALE